MMARTTAIPDRYLLQDRGVINVSCLVPPQFLNDILEGRLK